MTIIPILMGAFGTVTKGLIKGLEGLEIRGRVDSMQTNTLLRTASRVLETCWHSNSCERPSANADMKNSQGVNNDSNDNNNLKKKKS